MTGLPPYWWGNYEAEQYWHGDDEPPFVYFVGSVGLQLIKIGFSADLPTRLRALRTASADELYVFGAIKGGQRRETELHRAFAELRVRGEWFQLTDPLRSFVLAMLRSPYFYTPGNDPEIFGIPKDSGPGCPGTAAVSTGL